jgi:hypothetical protein
MATLWETMLLVTLKKARFSKKNTLVLKSAQWSGSGSEFGLGTETEAFQKSDPEPNKSLLLAGTSGGPIVLLKGPTLDHSFGFA